MNNAINEYAIIGASDCVMRLCNDAMLYKRIKEEFSESVFENVKSRCCQDAITSYLCAFDRLDLGKTKEDQLLLAIKNDDISTIIDRLEDASVNASESLALRLVARSGKMHLMRLIASPDADSDASINAVLMYLVIRNNIEMVKMFLFLYRTRRKDIDGNRLFPSCNSMSKRRMTSLLYYEGIINCRTVSMYAIRLLVMGASVDFGRLLDIFPRLWSVIPNRYIYHLMRMNDPKLLYKSMVRLPLSYGACRDDIVSFIKRMESRTWMPHFIEYFLKSELSHEFIEVVYRLDNEIYDVT